MISLSMYLVGMTLYKKNTTCQEMHFWIGCIGVSRPRSGSIFTLMSRSIAAFKLALRYCRKHEDQLRADACAKSLDLHDSKGFWNRVKKGNCDKATKYANCVGGVSGEDKIALLWKDHFNKLYNSVQDQGAKVFLREN